MGRVLTYTLEEEPREALMGMRFRGIDQHVVFEGDHREGEFSMRHPSTEMELRGLYSMEEGMLSVVLTHVPDLVSHREVEAMFERLVRPPVDL